jgi:hypothetical protein
VFVAITVSETITAPGTDLIDAIEITTRASAFGAGTLSRPAQILQSGGVIQSWHDWSAQFFDMTRRIPTR